MSKFTTTRHALLLALGLCTAAACTSKSATDESVQVELSAPKASQNTEALPADSIAAALPKLSAPELAELVATIEPQTARNGGLRFSDARLRTPAAAAALVDRLQHAGDNQDTRQALILALPGTQGDYAGAALEVLKSERNETLRAALVDSMRLAKDAAPALEGLKLGLRDSSAQVRARAAFNIGRRADGLMLVDALIAAVADSDASVQAASARALGQLGASQAFDKVLPLLQSGDADTRLESVRALARMDAERASKLGELTTLLNDKDERVRTAAGKTQAQAY